MTRTGECIISLNDKQIATQDVLKVNGKVMTKVFFRELPVAGSEEIEGGEVLGITVVDDIKWFVILYKNSIYKIEMKEIRNYYKDINKVFAFYSKEDTKEVVNTLTKLALSRLINNINNNKIAFDYDGYNWRAKVVLDQSDEETTAEVMKSDYFMSLSQCLAEQVKEYRDIVGDVYGMYSIIVRDNPNYDCALIYGVIDKEEVRNMVLKAINELLEHSLKSLRLYGKAGLENSCNWSKEKIKQVQDILESQSNKNYNIVGELIESGTDESDYSYTSIKSRFDVRIHYDRGIIGNIRSSCKLRLLDGSLEIINRRAKDLGVTGTAEEIMQLEKRIAQIKEAAYNRELREAKENNEIYFKFMEKADNIILIGKDLA